MMEAQILNKLKISSLSPQPLILIMAIFAFIAVPIRTFQLANCIDPETGFWLVRDFTVPVLYVLCGLEIAVSLFMSLFSGIQPKPEFPQKKNISLGIVSLVFALTFLIDAITRMSAYISLFSVYQYDVDGYIFGYIMKSGALSLTIQSIFALISALYFGIVGVSHIMGTSTYKKSKLLALSPVIWGISRMVYFFVNPISYKNVSQLLLTLMFITLAMIFFLSFARIASGVNEANSMWILWFSGTAGAFIGLVCALAPLVLIATGKGNLIPEKYPLEYTDLAFAAFAIGTLLSNMPRTVKNRTEG